MTMFVDARDRTSGALIATLPCSMFQWMEAPLAPGCARRLRGAFVDEGMLSLEQAEAADFELRPGKRPPV